MKNLKKLFFLFYIYFQGNLIKNRNEPCKIVQILEAVAQVLNIEEGRLAEICF